MPTKICSGHTNFVNEIGHKFRNLQKCYFFPDEQFIRVGIEQIIQSRFVDKYKCLHYISYL